MNGTAPWNDTIRRPPNCQAVGPGHEAKPERSGGGKGGQDFFRARLAKGLSEVRSATLIGTPGMSKASRRLLTR